MARREIVHNKKISNNKKNSIVSISLCSAVADSTRLAVVRTVSIFFSFLLGFEFREKLRITMTAKWDETFLGDARISLRHVSSVSSRAFSVEVSVVNGDTLFTLFFYFIFILFLRLLRTVLASWRRKICEYSHAREGECVAMVISVIPFHLHSDKCDVDDYCCDDGIQVYLLSS